MNERLVVKSFGPVRDLDITFKKVTLFIGDQGTGSKTFFHVQMAGKGFDSEKVPTKLFRTIQSFFNQALLLSQNRVFHSAGFGVEI